MFSEITARLLGKLDERFLQCLPAEDIDTHGSEVASRVRRFFLKFRDLIVVIRDQDSETACFLDRHRHSGNRDIRIIRFVIFQHDLIIHFVDVVTGKDQNVFRIVGLHVLQILVDRICGSSIPVAAFASLVRRKNRNAADVAV